MEKVSEPPLFELGYPNGFVSRRARINQAPLYRKRGELLFSVSGLIILELYSYRIFLLYPVEEKI